MPSKEADAAHHRTVVTSIELELGELRPPAVRADPCDLGFLVLEGLMLRRVEVAGGRTVELIGPGDVIRPWRDDDEGAQLRELWRNAPEGSLLSRLQMTPRGVKGPDFIDPVTGRWYDITTRAQWARHHAKYKDEFGDDGVGIVYTPG